MKKTQRMVHAQILLSRHPRSAPLGLDMKQLIEHWRAGLVDGEIREPMHTLFLAEDSFLDLVAYLDSSRAAGQHPK